MTKKYGKRGLAMTANHSQDAISYLNTFLSNRNNHYLYKVFGVKNVDALLSEDPLHGRVAKNFYFVGILGIDS